MKKTGKILLGCLLAASVFMTACGGSKSSSSADNTQTEDDPMLAQITHLAATCTEQQKRMVIGFIHMLRNEKYGD